ncbi:MAG: hypothetical protein ACI4M9_06245, partial [Succinivibrio sp.]
MSKFEGRITGDHTGSTLYLTNCGSCFTDNLGSYHGLTLRCMGSDSNHTIVGEIVYIKPGSDISYDPSIKG